MSLKQYGVLLLLCLSFLSWSLAETSTMLSTSFGSEEEEEEERRKKLKPFKYFLPFLGWHGLAVASLLKIKLVAVAVVVIGGALLFMASHYFWPFLKRCPHTSYEETVSSLPPFIYDHPSHTSAYDPYGTEELIPLTDWGVKQANPYVGYDSYAAAAAASTTSGRTKKANKRSLTRRSSVTSEEERIGNVLLNFLGLDTEACHRRFFCEMEYRAHTHLLTRLSYRMLANTLFSRYLPKNSAEQNDELAKNFEDCAKINSQCVFIENDEKRSGKVGEVVTNELTKKSQNTTKKTRKGALHRQLLIRSQKPSNSKIIE